MIFSNKNSSDKWKKNSFSQTGEDLIIKFIFDVIEIKNPSYIDIGAHHPFHLNNTALLYQNGSRGINIEPDPGLYKVFLDDRKEDTNLNCGVSSDDGELILKILNAPTLNTFSDEEAEKMVKDYNFKIVNRIPIKVYSIHTILNKYCNGIFPDFLNVDVEGLDDSIIRSIDFEKTKPSVICLETISYSEKGDGKKNIELINFLENKEYMVYADTYINTIFVLKNKWLKK